MRTRRISSRRAAQLRMEIQERLQTAGVEVEEARISHLAYAPEMLSRREVVKLDEERKVAMVSNLLVVLCGERNTQPVIIAGTLHH